MNHYYCFQIQLTEIGRRDELLAWLSDTIFESFVETETGLDAYLPMSAADIGRDTLAKVGAHLPLAYTEQPIPYQNWNAQWEASFQPVRVDGFVQVRASFHPAADDLAHDLVIDPRMAFGTGHHATTHMMIELMQPISLEQRAVLDYGCGTGILAILAARLGAEPVLAVDIEEEAYLNTLENATLNATDRIRVYHGTLHEVPTDVAFDVILANINRNVILESLGALYQRLLPDGLLLVSGILQTDRTILLDALLAAGFGLQREHSRDGWLAALLQK